MDKQATLTIEIHKSIQALKENMESKTQEIEQIKASINILANHIAVLENQNKGFLSKYKPFKRKGVLDDLRENMHKKRQSFSFND